MISEFIINLHEIDFAFIPILLLFLKEIELYNFSCIFISRPNQQLKNDLISIKLSGHLVNQFNNLK